MFNTITEVFFEGQDKNRAETDLVEVKRTTLRWNEKVLFKWASNTGRKALCYARAIKPSSLFPQLPPDVVVYYSPLDFVAREYVVVD